MREIFSISLIITTLLPSIFVGVSVAQENNTNASPFNTTDTKINNSQSVDESGIEPITITTSKIADESISSGEVVSPSEQNPLKFEFVSDGGSVNFECKILEVEQDIFDNLLSGGSIDANNLVGNTISMDNCGSGTSGNIEYAITFSDGLYVFQVIANNTNRGDVFPFEAIAGQADEGGGGVESSITSLNQGNIMDLRLLNEDCFNSHTGAAELVNINYEIIVQPKYPINFTSEAARSIPLSITMNDNPGPKDTILLGLGWRTYDFDPLRLNIICKFQETAFGQDSPPVERIEMLKFDGCSEPYNNARYTIDGKFDQQSISIYKPTSDAQMKISFKSDLQTGIINGKIDGYNFLLLSANTLCSLGEINRSDKY